MMYDYTFCVMLSFITATAPTAIYTLSLHDALPISDPDERRVAAQVCHLGRVVVSRDMGVNERTVGVKPGRAELVAQRSEEHTSELQSHSDLVCRLLLEKKKIENE